MFRTRYTFRELNIEAMWKNFLVAGIVVGIIVATAAVLLRANQYAGNRASSDEVLRPRSEELVLLHSNGTARTLKAADASQLVAEVGRFVAEADQKLRIIVDAARLRRITERGTALEVNYAEARTLQVVGREITYARLLIPIGGDLPDGVVFHAAGGEAFGGLNLVRNPHGTKTLQELLKPFIQKQ